MAKLTIQRQCFDTPEEGVFCSYHTYTTPPLRDCEPKGFILPLQCFEYRTLQSLKEMNSPDISDSPIIPQFTTACDVLVIDGLYGSASEYVASEYVGFNLFWVTSLD